MQRCLHGHFILGPKGALEVTLGRCGDGTNARAEGTQLLAAATEAREDFHDLLIGLAEEEGRSGAGPRALRVTEGSDGRVRRGGRVCRAFFAARHAWLCAFNARERLKRLMRVWNAASAERISKAAKFGVLSD